MLTATPPTELEERVRRAMRGPSEGGQLRIGVEVEMIPHFEGGGRVPLVAAEGRPGGGTLLEAAARLAGWRLGPVAAGTRAIDVPGVGVLSFEPGGQIEFSTIALDSVQAVVAALEGVVRPILRAADDLGLEIEHRGTAEGGIGDTPLLLDTERYRRQRAHYDRIGPWGRRMMGESAALHVNLDLGGRAARRWRVANRAAASFIALFANSPGTIGELTVRSERAEAWRRLDPSRTGVMVDEDDPVRAYTRFALEARHFLGAAEGTVAPAFEESWRNGAGPDEWRDHLTTLFPEVRPRGYLEVRSFDAVRPAWYGVPITVAVGLLYSPEALRAAEGLLPAPSTEALEQAGRVGMYDPEIRRRAADVFDLAIDGARALGPDIVGREQLEVAGAFRERFVARGVDPGTEGRVADPWAV